jgi:hypothetical protein
MVNVKIIGIMLAQDLIIHFKRENLIFPHRKVRDYLCRELKINRRTSNRYIRLANQLLCSSKFSEYFKKNGGDSK